MTLDQLRKKLERYETLLSRRAVLTAVAAQGSREWELQSSVVINGANTPFSFPIPSAVVDNVIANRLASLNADITALQTELGITP